MIVCITYAQVIYYIAHACNTIVMQTNFSPQQNNYVHTQMCQ